MLDPQDYRGRAGLYVLHFAWSVDYQTPGTAPGTPGAYGDYEHYIGESEDIGKRLRKHFVNSSDSAAFVKRAHELGVPFHLSYVRLIDDHERRLHVEKVAQLDPPRWCSTCADPDSTFGLL